MSIRPTERKESAYSTEETPLTDRELKTKEAKVIYYMILLFGGIDYILSVLIIINKSNFFHSEEENNFTLFTIELSSVTVFMIFILLSLYFFKLQLTKIIKYIYIIVTIIYFCYDILMAIASFVDDNYKSDWIDIIFFILIILTIIPRILFFCYIDTLIKKLIEIDDIKKGEEHDKFRQNLENKMERDDTNWSKTSLSSERKQQSQFISGNLNNNYNKLPNGENIASIKDNYIEEEKDNNNGNDED
jgi:hypothetical protein